MDYYYVVKYDGEVVAVTDRRYGAVHYAQRHFADYQDLTVVERWTDGGWYRRDDTPYDAEGIPSSFRGYVEVDYGSTQ